MPLAAVLQFIPLYHIFHDIYSVHTEVCVWVMVGLYVMVAWAGDRSVGTEARRTSTGGIIMLVVDCVRILFCVCHQAM